MTRYPVREYEVATKDGLCRAIVEVSGRWIAGSLEYGPPECPDASITQAWQTQDADREDGVWPEVEVRPDSVPDEVQEELIEAALWKDSERDDVAVCDGAYRPRGATR